MFVHYRSKGLIIKKANQGEADQLFVIYTEDFGKLKILAKGIRRVQSKLRGGADLFYFSEIEFIQGKNCKILTDAILLKKFASIYKDLEKFEVAEKISFSLDRFLAEEEKDPKIWQLLLKTFDRLENFEKGKIGIIYYYYFWNLISLLGYQPDLQKDNLCGRKIEPDLAKILKIILERNWQLLSRLKLNDRHLDLLKSISKWYSKNTFTKLL